MLGGLMATAFRKLDLEQLKKDIGERFQKARGEEVKPRITTEEKADILIRAAMKQLKQSGNLPVR
jgi:hypothetical protein